jgi:hypothetical protein
MKIISRFALASAATAGLFFATSAPAEAVGDHTHCLYTPSPQGYVLIAKGVSEEAPHEPTLHNFHERVHLGEPGQHVEIRRIDVGAECPPAPESAASEE